MSSIATRRHVPETSLSPVTSPADNPVAFIRAGGLSRGCGPLAPDPNGGTAPMRHTAKLSPV